MNELFDQAVLQQVMDEFPDPAAMAGHFGGEIEGGKHTESDWSKFGPVTRAFVAACNSGPFMHALTAMTGIEGLLPDPYLSGGGQHQTGRGGRLSRRLNMLVYLNDPWEESWGGALELWDKDMAQAVVMVPPVFGQVAMFTCSDTSFHGLPDALACPAGTYRKSLAFYYYTAEDTTPEPRSTLWKERPGEDFLSRPSARFRAAAGHARRAAKALVGK
jgi:hypothetical protein